MRKLGIVQMLIRCLERNDFHLLIVALGFLRKLSVMAEFKEQMVPCGLCSWGQGWSKSWSAFLAATTRYC